MHTLFRAIVVNGSIVCSLVPNLEDAVDDKRRQASRLGHGLDRKSHQPVTQAMHLGYNQLNHANTHTQTRTPRKGRRKKGENSGLGIGFPLVMFK